MIEVTVKTDLKYMEDFNQRLSNLLNSILPDVKTLGAGCYNYLKTIIPISKISHPHLRDSFDIQVNKSILGTEGYILLKITPIGPAAIYAGIVNEGATIPDRPKGALTKKAMKFDSASGDVVYTRKAKGFTLKGIQFVDKGETWLLSNYASYIDLSLGRYL